MEGRDTKALRGKAREIISWDRDTDNNDFEEEKGEDTNCPREKTHGNEINGKQKNFNNGFNDFIKKKPDNGGSKEDAELWLNRKTGINLIDEIEGTEINENMS